MPTYDILRIIGVSVLTFVVLLLIGRSLRLATRRIARGRSRVGVELADARPAGPPVHRHRPHRRRLGTFAGAPATEPIRVYAGLRSAGSARAQAQLVLDEMDRTGAWDRAAIGVLTPTGTGWLDSAVTDSLEYLYAGDTALVSMQYSYLPSWISFLPDRSKVRETASVLIGAVRDRWAALPARTRPRLLLFGESLGSYGTESAFTGLSAMAGTADGGRRGSTIRADPTCPPTCTGIRASRSGRR